MSISHHSNANRWLTSGRKRMRRGYTFTINKDISVPLYRMRISLFIAPANCPPHHSFSLAHSTHTVNTFWRRRGKQLSTISRDHIFTRTRTLVSMAHSCEDFSVGLYWPDFEIGEKNPRSTHCDYVNVQMTRSLFYLLFIILLFWKYYNKFPHDPWIPHEIRSLLIIQR